MAAHSNHYKQYNILVHLLQSSTGPIKMKKFPPKKTPVLLLADLFFKGDHQHSTALTLTLMQSKRLVRQIYVSST